MTDIMDYEVMKLALRYYSDKQLAHALHVAEYAVEGNPFAEFAECASLWRIGLLHDILEDTDCPYDELGTLLTKNELNSIQLLTHDKENDGYEYYIAKIVESHDPYALAVKRADMKDHLWRENTLTQKLKDKYYPIIKYLL